YIHLIIDNRICLNVDINHRAREVSDFIDNINNRYILSKIIVTGSSIPASIRDLLIPGYSNDFQRAEIDLYRIVKKKHSSIFLGDYTVVSPNYSDVQLERELLRKVTAPKLFYAYQDKMYIARGHALETHPRGNKQYNDLCAIVVGKSFYRTPLKSFGDKYLHEKANNIGKDPTPSTIPKPLVNLHITYMLTDFVF
ncbi:beta family protein, partial [Acinetobacter baumannii]|nr:beta family protein [Acinetobacter baumannii]